MDRSKVLAGLIMAAIIAGVLTLGIGINLLRAGGDWGCVFTQEPQICVAIKGAGS